MVRRGGAEEAERSVVANRYDAFVNLRRTVASRARVEGDLVMVDDFINHRVDPEVIGDVGRALAAVFAPLGPDLVLTAEASGIPPALTCSIALDLPMVYAKKYLGTGKRYTFAREVMSPTKGVEYRVEVARRVLEPGMSVVIVDDFLSGGRTAEALGEIAEEAGCDVLGFGFIIEKAWKEGRSRLEAHGWPVTSLVTVDSLVGGLLNLEQPV
jgi:xanthine phosphoribosyltransferase